MGLKQNVCCVKGSMSGLLSFLRHRNDTNILDKITFITKSKTPEVEVQLQHQ